MAASNGSGNGYDFGFAVRPRDPLFGLIYGESNTGKSTVCLYAFPNGLFIGPKGGITHIGLTVVGWIPRTDGVGNLPPVQDLEALIGLVEQHGDKFAAAGIDALVCDDISIFAERSFRAIKQRLSGDTNKYLPYTIIANLLFKLRDLLRALNIHAVLNAHPMYAWVDEDSGIRILGRPMFPGKLAPIHFPPAADFVFQSVRGLPAPPPPANGPLGAPGGIPASVSAPPPRLGDWDGLFRTDSDGDWYRKGRTDTPDPCPMNLGEILRDLGYPLSRAPGLEWQEPLVEATAGHVLAGNDLRAVLPWMYAQARGEIAKLRVVADTADKLVRWTERDALMRVWLRMKKRERFARFHAQQGAPR